MSLDVAFPIDVNELPDGDMHVSIQEMNTGWRHVRQMGRPSSHGLGNALPTLAWAWWEQEGPGKDRWAAARNDESQPLARGPE